MPVACQFLGDVNLDQAYKKIDVTPASWHVKRGGSTLTIEKLSVFKITPRYQILLMEEILYQLMVVYPNYLQGFI